VSRRKPIRFDPTRLRLKPLADRAHDLRVEVVKPLEPVAVENPVWRTVASRYVEAKRNGRACVLMIGAHVIRSGVQKYIIDLMERGYVTCLAMNGGAVIHDYELARIGATTESVNRYVSEGQFGLWRETGEINDIVNRACERDAGMGEAVGEAIEDGGFAHKAVSLLAAAWRCGIPATAHIGIGFDIIHEHPNFSGAAAGETSYRDFLAFTAELERLEGGVVANFGSAVMAPEVYLKALSMARNVAHQRGEHIRRFTTLVCDIRELPPDLGTEPAKDEPAYYYRPLKTMLVRTVADGGESHYIRGMHAETVPALWTAINQVEES